VKVYESKDILTSVWWTTRFRQDHAHRWVLFTAGASNRLLRVDGGGQNHHGSTRKEFQAQSISISTAIAVAEWKKATNQYPRYSGL